MHNVQKIVTFLAALALFLALASAASAKRLPLDSSFGERGKTVAEPGPTFDEAIFSAVAPQPDDSILVTRSSGDSVGWLQRYLADGSRDTSYPTVPPPAEPRATQADGKVLERANGASIQRREPDGSPDPTFGTQAWGAAKRSDDVPFTIEQILPLAGGDIVVAGSAYRYEYFDDGEPYRVFDQLAVARFDEGGALDPGFGGGDGIVLLGTDYGFPGQALVGLAPRPGEGTILVTDDLQPNQHGIVFTHAGSALLGLTPAGGFDPSYGAGGIAGPGRGGRRRRRLDRTGTARRPLERLLRQSLR
jgi:hypothetical protein